MYNDKQILLSTKEEYFILFQTVDSCVEETGSKLSPMTQPYLPLALTLPGNSHQYRHH